MLTSAIVNSGFEATSREVVLPLSLAAALGLASTSPGAQALTYFAAGGETQVHRLHRAALARIVTTDRKSAKVVVDVVLLPIERQVIISDALGSALHVVILDLKKGEWCFSDELGVWRRPSEISRLW